MRQEPEGFKEFWEQVWRQHARHTDGRGSARDAYAKHLKAGAEPQDIIDGARCFFRTMKDRDRDYVPLCATWLNRGAYEDLAEQERAHQKRLAEIQQRRVQDMTNVVTMQPPASESISPERRAELVAKIRLQRA